MKKLLLALALVIPLLLFMNVWQVFRYQALKKEVAMLLEEQQELFEANKRALVEIAELQSPSRIRDIAENELGLVKPDSSNTYDIWIRREGEKDDE